MTVFDQPLTETFVWNHMIPSFLNPIDGDPARPATLVVCRREFCDAWEPLLSEIGVRCRYENDPQPVGQLLEAMGRVIEKRALPPAQDLDIREFPQSDAVWQTDFFRSPAWVNDEQEGPHRPWSVLVLDTSRSIALTTCHAPGDPTPEMLLEFLVRTMARPDGGPAQRPRLVEVADSDCYDHLRPRLEAAGVACRLVDDHGGRRSAIDRPSRLADRYARSVAGGDAARAAPPAAFSQREGIGVARRLPTLHPRFHHGESNLAHPASGNRHAPG